MSDEPHLPTRQDLAREREKMPGCGLAAYVVILMSVTALGISGLFISTSSLLQVGPGAAPSALTYGANVPDAALVPLRAAGLLGPDELPELYHAEDMMGARACAVSKSTVMRLDETGKHTLALTEIQKVEETEDGVRLDGPVSFTCYFGRAEGGDRFARMIQASAPQAAPLPDAPPAP